MSLSLSTSTLSLPSRTAGMSTAASIDALSGKLPSCMNSTDILRGQKAVEITHNGSVYRLQATRLGKLILTK
jgi:hemin uptake protein HemP